MRMDRSRYSDMGELLMCRLWQTRIGFGGPWMKGKMQGQMSLFTVYRLEYDTYEQYDPSYGYVIFNSLDWIGI
jgi:hypothetical protein